MSNPGETRPPCENVAEMVGVSKQTVSAVSNNKPASPKRQRDAVLAAIETLGYRPTQSHVAWLLPHPYYCLSPRT